MLRGENQQALPVERLGTMRQEAPFLAPGLMTLWVFVSWWLGVEAGHFFTAAFCRGPQDVGPDGPGLTRTSHRTYKSEYLVSWCLGVEAVLD